MLIHSSSSAFSDYRSERTKSSIEKTNSSKVLHMIRSAEWSLAPLVQLADTPMRIFLEAVSLGVHHQQLFEDFIVNNEPGLSVT